MSVSSIGASAYLSTQHRWDWQNNRPLGQNITYNTINTAGPDTAPRVNTTAGSNGAGTTRNTVNATTPTTATNAAGTTAPPTDRTTGGATVTTQATDDGDEDRRPPPPPPQSASAPGTGQKVNIIA